MCLHFLKEAQEVQVAKVLEVVKVARAVKKVLEAAKATRKAAKDVREQAAVTATDSASKPSATRPKITCCNASANPIPVSTSLINKAQEVTEVPVVQEVLVVTEDSEVVITMALAQAAQEALVAPAVMDSKEANSSFSKLARTTKPTPIKPRPVCPTLS